MKNTLICFVSFLLLISCAENNQYIQNSIVSNEISEEEILGINKNIFDTLEFYTNYFGTEEIVKCNLNPYLMMFSTVAPEDRECFYYSSIYNSDKCILARRNTTKTKICYFNYKKYLPKEFDKFTEDDFLEIANTYKRSRVYKSECFSNMQLTSDERVSCANNIDSYVYDFAVYNTVSKNRLKKCISIAPQEYLKTFVTYGDISKEQFRFSSYSDKDKWCKGKIDKDLQNTLKEDSIVQANCGYGIDCIRKYRGEQKYNEYYFERERNEHLNKMVKFGIDHNCYISVKQFQNDYYNEMVNFYKSGCNKPVVYYKSDPLEVRIVD